MASEASLTEPSDRKGSSRPRIDRGRRAVLILAAGFLLLIGVGAATAWMVQDTRRQNDLVAHTLQRVPDGVLDRRELRWDTTDRSGHIFLRGVRRILRGARIALSFRAG